MKTRSDRLLISLQATPPTVGFVRTLTAGLLRRWNCAHITDDVLIVASELTTNAIKATPGGEIRYRLTHDADAVVTAVWDSDPRLPAPRPPGAPSLETLDLSHPDDNGGRGLSIVAALSVENGCTPHPDGGKWVWALMKH